MEVIKEFSIPFLKGYHRPVIKLYNLKTLIDTGSIIPVFSIVPEVFEKYFESKKNLDRGIIGGFGGNEIGAVYAIKNFKIGDLIFNNFEVFVPETPRLQFPFLLSATLFYGMDYEFDTINEKFIVKMNDEQNLERKF